MASPCRAGAGGGVIQNVKGIPSAKAAGAGGWSGTSRASTSSTAAALVVVIRRVQGVPSTTAAGAGGSVIQRVHGVTFPHGGRWWWWSGTSRASPSAMAAGAGDGVGRACLWWYSVLSTHYIGMRFYRPVATIGRVIRPDFCVNANLQNFFT